MGKMKTEDMNTIQEVQGILTLITDIVMEDLSDPSREALSKMSWKAVRDLETILSRGKNGACILPYDRFKTLRKYKSNTSVMFLQAELKHPKKKGRKYLMGRYTVEKL